MTEPPVCFFVIVLSKSNITIFVFGTHCVSVNSLFIPATHLVGTRGLREG